MVENLVKLHTRNFEKPIDDLTKLFSKLRNNKKFLKERDFYFKNYVGALLHLSS